MRTAARSFTTARKRNNVPSTPLAANSTASSLSRSTEPASYPQIPPTRPILELSQLVLRLTTMRPGAPLFLKIVDGPRAKRLRSKPPCALGSPLRLYTQRILWTAGYVSGRDKPAGLVVDNIG